MRNTTFEFNYDLIWRVVLVLAVISMLFTVTSEVLATGTGTTDNQDGTKTSEITVIGPLMCKIANGLTGGIARGIATIAIFSVGVGLFMGKLNWGTSAAVAAGVAIIFGAPKLVAFFSADGNDNCPTADTP